ncbi:hypothetical protein C7266_06365 [Klebsiella variicola]|uniref:hypothetical protein n=1 Tax=Klebsiella variicola TaxID=244366 RepID=UPI001C7E2B65|nr:hypothetical protein [Klebsiella variicola]MBX4606937.1 hypothetical protein [Klebsiella variicola]
MSKSKDKAINLMSLLDQGIKLEDAKKSLISNEQEWYRVSKKIYDIHISKEKKERKDLEKEGEIGFTKNNEVDAIIELNNQLSEYALALPHKATMADFKQLKQIIENNPTDENALILKIESIIMTVPARARMQKGRFEHYDIFKSLSRLIEAATLCYYRQNYQSAFLTLVPIIEGSLLRWIGYDGNTNKPEFEILRKFFRTGHLRQPCPGNPLFYDVFSKVSNKILNEHLFKPSNHGEAYSNFNRHLAAHLLNDSSFATKENCVRLFLLLDIMSELYFYETHCPDPWFYLEEKELMPNTILYEQVILSNRLWNTPEKTLLSQRKSDS